MGTEDQNRQGVTFVIQVLEVQVFLCVKGRFWDSLWRGLGWSPEVALSVRNSDLRCVIISFLHLSFVVYIVIATNSFTFCLAQLRDGPNLRADIKSAWRRQLSMQRQLRTRTILWTRVLSPFIVLGRSLLLSSCATLKLKEKRVSVRFVDNALKCILVISLCGRYLHITMLNLYN